MRRWPASRAGIGDLFGDRAYLAPSYLRRPNDILRLTCLTEMSEAARPPASGRNGRLTGR